MSIAIPERILNYRISATTPTDELLTLRHIYSDIGEYASTILDREHATLSKKCATRLNKVEKQLLLRHGCLSKENVHDKSKDLSAMTVDELYNLYRGWHLRHRKREAEGRELITFYYEGKIVKELQRRKPTDNGEQLKIDY
ncbi:MAG: hypothetical protein K2J78_08390, partial [Muribaculaceae bacterium]|nr:hypothetical protein [Muribaculaceae bacterium]